MARPILGLIAAVSVAALPSAAGPTQNPPPSQQRPVFRAGTHYVRVDAYPTRDGEIVRNLDAEDFELFEDGRPQAIRARRQYLAPTEEEMATSRAALETSPAAPPELPARTVALEELARIGRDELLARADVDPDGLRVVVELGSGLASTDRWRQGADVVVEVHGDGGSVLAAVNGRIEAGTRSAIVGSDRPAGAGPWRLTVRTSPVRGAAADPVELLLEAAEPAAWPGRPAVFRASGGPRAPLQPVAELLFRRTERVHLEWHVPQDTRATEAHVVRANGDAVELPVVLGERTDANGQIITAEVALAPLAAADYVIEVMFTDGKRATESMTAIRVTR